MSIEEHVTRIRQGVGSWNAWREETAPWPESRFTLRGGMVPDLSDADLDGLDLHGADLYGAQLYGASLRTANLDGADLRQADLFVADLVESSLGKALLRRAHLFEASLFGADLTGADLRQADLQQANLHGAILRGADLTGANLSRADLGGADLTGADLTNAVMVETDLTGATLAGCQVYGVSAWNVSIDTATRQHNLLITAPGDADVWVDHLECAQLIYVLLAGPRLREVIDTLTTKTVLILGRFTAERKVVLDAIRAEVRRHGYVPILFDFEKPASRDLTETVSTLAHLARFVIADITDAKSIPQELERIVPDLPSVPVQPVLQESEREYAMFEHFRRYPWVLEPYRYRDTAALIAHLQDEVIAPAEAKARELAPG